jgi:hypothetical protein
MRHHGTIQLPVDDPVLQRDIVSINQLDVSTGMSFQKGGQDRKKEQGHDASTGTEPEATWSDTLLLTGDNDSLVHTGHDRTSHRQHSFSERRALYVSSIPFEQRSAKFGLEPSNTTADSGLSAVQSSGSLTETAGLCYGHERFENFTIHLSKP